MKTLIINNYSSKITTIHNRADGLQDITLANGKTFKGYKIDQPIDSEYHYQETQEVNSPQTENTKKTTENTTTNNTKSKFTMKNPFNSDNKAKALNILASGIKGTCGIAHFTFITAVQTTELIEKKTISRITGEIEDDIVTRRRTTTIAAQNQIIKSASDSYIKLQQLKGNLDTKTRSMFNDLNNVTVK